MSYILGLDLGTTSTAAAVNDGEATRIFTHPSGQTAIPSVLALDADGQFLVGEAAIRHGSLEPGAVAREFKRRFGDTTPLLLRGTPVAANDLTVRLARAVVDEVSGQIGEPPERLVVCHPANWGSFKLSLLADTLANSALPPHDLISEPEAAAVHYAGLERMADQTLVAVYDLGGGTFDVAVLQKDDAGSDGTGWRVVGRPGGIERLGGIDFDTAVFSHVLAAAGVDLDAMDHDDTATQLSVSRLREACAQAKVALSSEPATTVAVSLPGVEETVRVTRSEFEAMIGPPLDRTLETLDVTLANAGLTADDLHQLLLVGGSSRIPAVSQRLTAHTRRPVMTDAHPKNAIALGAAATKAPERPGAATTQSTGLSTSRTMVLPADVMPPAQPATPEPAPTTAQDPLGPPETPPAETDLPAALGTNFPAVPHMSDEPVPDFLVRRQGVPIESYPAPAETQPIPAVAVPPDEPRTQRLPDDGNEPQRTDRRNPWAVVAAIVLLVACAAAGYVLVDRLSDGGTEATSGSTTGSTSASTTASVTASVTVSTLLAEESNCPTSEEPTPGQNYRVVELPDDDPDGGLNGRAAPSLTADVVVVFASQSPVKVTGRHCEVDEAGRTWWGARSTGDLVWVAANFLEPLE